MIRLDDLRRALGAAMVGLAAVLAGAAHAQVLAIGDDGAVTRYPGPAVFTAQGARPLTPPSAGPRVAPAGEVTRALSASAARHGLDPALVTAVARQESGFRQHAISPKGAIGVMQLMPGTARDLGVDPRDPAANVEGGTAYLARLIGRYRGDVATALAAYNAGPGAVARSKGEPPFPGTQAYVNSVLSSWGKHRLNGGKVGI